MKNVFIKLSAIMIMLSLIIAGVVIPSQIVKAEPIVPIYRLNNPSSGEYLFTSDAYEAEVLTRQEGWVNEGIGWNAPIIGEPIYRLYHPTGLHIYTSDANEINVLTTERGWIPDNNNEPLFYSGGNTNIYRVYNPASKRHLLTADKNEYNLLTVNGWTGEGIAISARSSDAAQNYVRGVWFSFLDWQKCLKGKNEAEFRKEFARICDVSAKNNINTMFMHVRSHNDAAYPSDYYPWSSQMLSGVPSYDPLKIIVEIAHGKGIAIHAWVNPYGYRNGVFSGDRALATKENIVAGVREIVQKYDVDGIHFDDYFPVDDPAVHNELIREVYKTVHATGKVFGISPEGTIANNRRYGADVDTWLSQEGYVDYIAPQIYWSDEYGQDGSITEYTNTLNQWKSINKLDIPVYVGLALYKVATPFERDPGWTRRSDNLITQIKKADDAGWSGYGLFRYAFLEIPETQQELMNVVNEGLNN